MGAPSKYTGLRNAIADVMVRVPSPCRSTYFSTPSTVILCALRKVRRITQFRILLVVRHRTWCPRPSCATLFVAAELG